MRHLFILLSVCCASAGVHAPQDTAMPLPELVIPADTLLLREHLSSRGPERTGNWWSRFDQDGCYTEAHNTWMWVMDPVLRRSDAWPLHWNGSPRLEPWFCLQPVQLAQLKAAMRAVSGERLVAAAAGPLDRWTLVGEGGAVTAVVPLGADPGALSPVTRALEEIAAQGVWGLSPELDDVPIEEVTAFLP